MTGLNTFSVAFLDSRPSEMTCKASFCDYIFHLAYACIRRIFGCIENDLHTDVG